MSRSDLLLFVSCVSEVLFFLVAVRLIQRHPWRLVGVLLLMYAWITISQEVLHIAVKFGLRRLIPLHEMTIGPAGRLLQSTALLTAILAALAQLVKKRIRARGVVPPDLPVA